MGRSRSRTSGALVGDETCCSPVGGISLTVEQAERFADVLRVLAEPSRLRLISIMGSSPDAPACGCELTGPLGLSQPTISHHLHVLLEAGLIEPVSGRERAEGSHPDPRCAYYRLVPGALSAVARALTPSSGTDA